MPISKINENTWEQYITDQQTQSSRTLADDAKLMMAVMKYAFNERFIDRKVRIRNPDPPTEEGRAYTDEEIFRLLGAASTDHMRLQIMIGWKMGMRHGEIAGLMWAWVDFKDGRIRLPAEITKTRRGRVVPLNAEVAGLLASRLKSQAPKSPFVFPSAESPDKPIPDFDSQWQRTWQRAGVEGRFHFLRHTCISNMAANGIPESTIRGIVGCSERTMRKVYMHLKDDLAGKAVNL
jgi:integrase